jgi:hypothetical protein
MHEILVPIVALVCVFGGSILLIKTLTDYWLRRKLVDKGLVSEQATNILKSDYTENKYVGLKWGLIILFGGIGLIVINFLPSQFDHESSMPYGIFCVSVSIGFLVYYFMVNRDLPK